MLYGSVLIAYADYSVNKGMMDLYQVFPCESIDLEWSQMPMDSRLGTSAWHCWKMVEPVRDGA
jgi:hypothetical protein